MVLMQERKKKKTHVFNGALNIGVKGSTPAMVYHRHKEEGKIARKSMYYLRGKDFLVGALRKHPTPSRKPHCDGRRKVAGKQRQMCGTPLVGGRDVV